jgi:PIN domain nuclease of toxin-antitoxin system
MNLLLDTHIWIWNHLAPEKISSEVNGILAASENELWLSPVSVWELIMLVEKKRLELDKWQRQEFTI